MRTCRDARATPSIKEMLAGQLRQFRSTARDQSGGTALFRMLRYKTHSIADPRIIGVLASGNDDARTSRPGTFGSLISKCCRSAPWRTLQSPGEHAGGMDFDQHAILGGLRNLEDRKPQELRAAVMPILNRLHLPKPLPLVASGTVHMHMPRRATGPSAKFRSVRRPAKNRLVVHGIGRIDRHRLERRAYVWIDNINGYQVPMTGTVNLVVDGAVATITLDNQAKRNSIDLPMAAALVGAARRAWR